MSRRGQAVSDLRRYRFGNHISFMSKWWKLPRVVVLVVVLAVASAIAYACAPDIGTPSDVEPNVERTGRIPIPSSPEAAKSIREALSVIRQEWEASPPTPDAHPEDIDAFFKAIEDALLSPDGEASIEVSPRFRPDSTRRP